ncbi:putative mRNA 3-end processing factor [bacterium A37T11]|nr:putative mRNA 3-end processing factor [bacterium A37T11]
MEILADFLVIGPGGLYCKYGDFYIDPIHAVRQAVISHAHGDHAVPGNVYFWSTPATAAIAKYRHGRQNNTHYEQVHFGQEFKIGSVHLKLIPAGHILGSAQILMEYQGVKYLYTGDYKLQSDETCEPISPVQADVMITESTFANPTIKHPHPDSEICKFNNTSFNVMLGCYSLGKAQRLNALIQANCPGKTVLLHHSILPIHKIYEQFGINQLRYLPFDRKLMKQATSNYIYLVPPVTFNNHHRAKNLLRAFASGWSHHHAVNDISIFISDHADWDDIISYVNKVQPKEIWTLHGKGEHLQQYFKDKIPVKVLNQ